jgi:hypothetical protein
MLKTKTERWKATFPLWSFHAAGSVDPAAADLEPAGYSAATAGITETVCRSPLVRRKFTTPWTVAKMV